MIASAGFSSGSPSSRRAALLGASAGRAVEPARGRGGIAVVARHASEDGFQWGSASSSGATRRSSTRRSGWRTAATDPEHCRHAVRHRSRSRRCSRLLRTMQFVERGDLALDTRVMPYRYRGHAHQRRGHRPLPAHAHVRIADDADEEAGEDYELLFVDKLNYSIRETKDFLPGSCTRSWCSRRARASRQQQLRLRPARPRDRERDRLYRDYVRRHVFERGGMTERTSAQWTASIPGRRALQANRGRGRDGWLAQAPTVSADRLT